MSTARLQLTQPKTSTHTSKEEFAALINTRKYEEQERFNLLILSVVGKRLIYQQLIS